MTPKPSPAAARPAGAPASQPRSGQPEPVFTARTVFERYLGAAPSAHSTVPPPAGRITTTFGGPLTSAKLSPADVTQAMNGAEAFARYRTTA